MTVDDVVVDIVGIDGYYQKKTCVRSQLLLKPFLHNKKMGEGMRLILMAFEL